MRISPRLFRALAWCAVIISAAALPFIGFAVLEGRNDLARGFTLTCVSGFFMGGLILAGTSHVTPPPGPCAALRRSLFGWFLAPLLAAPPLIVATGSPVKGVFEAYSALTTTGAITLSPQDAGVTITLWRCVLAWMGGLSSLVLAATVFAALDRRGVGLRRTHFLTVEGADLFTNFGPALRRLGAVYTGITLAGACLLMILDVTPYDALCLSLSAIATAGLSPQSGYLSDWLPHSAIFVLVLICMSGAWNMAVQYDFISRRRIGRGTGELRAIILVAVCVGIVALMFVNPFGAINTVFDTVFAITTSGYQTSAQAALPLTFVILLAMAGGSTISTTGGIKLPRVLLLIRRAGGELSMLSHPSAALRTRFIGRPVSDSALTSVWVYALAYPLALGLGAAVLGIMGVDFETSWAVSAASLVNSGPLAGIDYNAIPYAALGVSIVLMVLGRLEVLAAAAAIFVIFARD